MSGLPAARQTDMTAYGGPIIHGSLTVLIGSQGGIACSVCPGGVAATKNPVNPQLGAKVLLGAEDLDFALPGALPVVWQRQYSSYVNAEHGAACGLLGHGWHLLTELSIEPQANRLLLFDANGRVITFNEALQPAGQNYSASEDLWLIRGGKTPEGHLPAWKRQPRFAHVSVELAQEPNAIIAASGTADILWLFTPGTADRWRLSSQIDRFGRRQSYSYSSGSEETQPKGSESSLLASRTNVLPEGKLIAITDGTGRRYRLEHQRIHAGKPAEEPWGADDGWRLAQVQLEHDPLHPLPKPIVLVRYSYDSQGLLSQVHDRAGELAREFKWEQRRIVAHRHRRGPWHSYRYANTDLGYRVIEHGNEEGLSYRFEYRHEKPSEQGRPRHSAQVIDSLDRKERYLFEGEAGLSRLIEHHRADRSVLRYKYDGYGRLVERTDPLGRTGYIRLNLEGNVLGVQLPDGSTTSQEYDETGRIIQSRDLAGVVTSYSYDEYKRLTEIRQEASGSAERYRYPDPSRELFTCDSPAEIEDAKGGVKKLQWSKDGLLISHTDCSGKTTRWDYDRWGQAIKVTDAQDHATRYERDSQGRVITTHWPNRQSEHYHYDERGQLIRIEPPADEGQSASPIELAYDLWSRLIRRSHGGLTVQLAYDTAGRLITLTNENAAQSQFSWDEMDRLVQETGFDGRIQRYQWDAAGQLIEASDGQKQTWQQTRYRWNALGRLLERILPATQSSPSQSHRYEWDAANRLKSVSVYSLAEQEQLQSRIELQRDDAGRLTGEVQRLYNPGQMVTAQVEFEHHIAHRLDELGNRTASQLQEAGSIQWLLYGSGHVHGLTHEQQNLIDFERDSLHREIKRQWHGLTDQTALSQNRWRDQLGRLQSIELKGLPAQTAAPQILISQISQRRYHYDALGQITVIQNASEAHRFGYDAAGRLRSRINSLHPDKTQRWELDPAGNRLPSKMPTPQGQQKNWAELVRQHWQDPGFNVLGQGTLEALEHGPIEQWRDNRIGYRDGQGDGNGSVLRYDVHGNRIEQFTELEGGHYTRQTLAYDGAHQLVSLQVDGPDKQGHTVRQSESWFIYDALGRRLKKTTKCRDGKEQVTYYGWDGDRLVHTERVHQQDSGETARQIDHTVYEPGSFTPLVRLSTTAQGNRQQKPHLAVQAIKTALSGQAEQELATMQGVISAMPASDQKLMEQTLRQVMEQGLPKQARNILGEEMAQSTSQLLKTMETGLYEQRRQEREEHPIAIHYYHCDHLGTPLALTDGQGNIVWAAKYDPWGNIEEEFNPNNIHQDIRLPGQHHDRETGLYYNRHRYYDPKLGSYINQDPIGFRGGINSYKYPFEPIRWIDPLGLQASLNLCKNYDGSDECARLSHEIDQIINRNKHECEDEDSIHGLRFRFAEQINGLQGPGTPGWSTHDEQIMGLQNKLRKDLRKWDDNGCPGKGYSLPVGAETWATRPRPTASDWNNRPMESTQSSGISWGDIGTGVLALAVGVGAGIACVAGVCEFAAASLALGGLAKLALQ